MVVARHWRVDLIESRRSLRLWFCGLNGVYIFVLIFVREVVFPELEWLEPFQYVPVGGILLATNALLLEYKRELTGEPAPVEAEGQAEVTEVDTKPRVTPDIPIETLQQLEQLMEGEACYREAGLTIGRLANRLALPDHRLRQIINAGLGYRNFNDFLNSYRVGETASRPGRPRAVSPANIDHCSGNRFSLPEFLQQGLQGYSPDDADSLSPPGAG